MLFILCTYKMQNSLLTTTRINIRFCQGVSSDRLSAKFGISREEQDMFTVRSHGLAAKAHADG